MPEPFATAAAGSERTRVDEARPHVVIVGGGFAGVHAARALSRAPVRVTLIDRNNYHLFRPMLYQVATGLLSANEVAAPIRGIFRRQRNVDVLMAEVTGIDPHNRRVVMSDQTMEYDYLVLATGVRYNYFGHPEWGEVASSLTTIEDAVRIRGRVLEALETAERLAAEHPGDPQVDEWLTFVLVGGGPTGVELAGSIAELRNSIAQDFRHVDLERMRIVIYESAPHVLAQFPDDLAVRSQQRLRDLGVEVSTGSRVECIDTEGVVVNGQRVRSRTVIWAAGVLGSPAASWLGAEMDRQRRVKVNPDLSVPGHPEIFVIGDTASLSAPTRDLLGRLTSAPQPVPALAQPAMQQGDYVGALIARRVAGRPPLDPFCYHDKGNMAIVGGYFAVADLKIARFSGLPAWFLWLVVHIYYLISFANRLMVMLQWGMSFLTNRRQARVFPVLETARATSSPSSAGSAAAVPEPRPPLTVAAGGAAAGAASPSSGPRSEAPGLEPGTVKAA